MNKLRENLPPLPPRLHRLPIDDRGYPVPWFVQWINGKPDFRVMDADKRIRAVREKRCWTCGDILGARFAFVIGPMCAINRISAEPPSHRECAEYSARACPFLTMPKMVRRENDLPEGYANPGGEMIARNPGVALLWLTRGYRVVKAEPTFLFVIGDPFETVWYKEGRPATRAEVMESIDSGYPLLLEEARSKPIEYRDEAVAFLEQSKLSALALLPV